MATTKKFRVRLKLEGPKIRAEYRLYEAECSWARTYAEQLEEIGLLLIRAKILTRRAIARDGVRFALANKFEPRRAITISKRKQTLKSAIQTWKR